MRRRACMACARACAHVRVRVQVHAHGACVQAPLAPSFAFTGEVKRTEWYSTVSPALTLSLSLSLTLTLSLSLTLTLTPTR